MPRRTMFGSLAFVLSVVGLAASSSAQDVKPSATPAAPASAFGPAGVATPAAADLPSGAAIVAKFIEATGGREAYEKISSRRAVGKVEMAAMGISGTVTIVSAAPRKLKYVMDLGNLGTSEQATDGEHVWMNTTATGPAIVSGDERKQFLAGATFQPELRLEESYSEVVTQGVEKVGEAECYKVKFTSKLSGDSEIRFYDKATGLLVKTNAVAKTSLGEVPSETVYAEWKAVDGVKLPHVLRLGQMGMQFEITMTEIAHNAELAADAFAMPAEVKALLEADTPAAGDAAKPAPAEGAPKGEAPAGEPKAADPK